MTLPYSLSRTHRQWEEIRRWIENMDGFVALSYVKDVNIIRGGRRIPVKDRNDYHRKISYIRETTDSLEEDLIVHFVVDYPSLTEYVEKTFDQIRNHK